MAYQQVDAQFTKANNYALSASALATGFINALQGTVSGIVMPNMDVDLTWPEAPVLAPQVPVDVDLPSTNFPSDDTGLVPAEPVVSIDTSGEPGSPALGEFTYSPGADPSKPVSPGELSVVTLPAEPENWTPPDLPAMLDISIQPFGGVNTYGEWVDRLASMPDDLVLAAPTAFNPALPDPYNSSLLTAMSDALRARMQQSTGLSPVVEQAIWDRARSREAVTAANNVAEVMRNAAARGFFLPTGALHAALREAQKVQYARESELSRDIAMKQADLEQSNIKHAIEHGIALEARLIEYANNIEQRAFESARFLAQNAVEIYNAQVAQYRALLEKYNTYAGIYRSLIEAENAKVAVFRAQIDAERAKVDINRGRIDQVRALIEIRTAQIEVYKSQLSAVQTLVEVDKVRIQAFGERVKAYVAEVNAEAVKADVFKTQVQSNTALTETYKARVDAYAAGLSARSGLARTRAEIYDAQVRGFSSKVQAYAAKVSAEAERVRAAVSIGGLKIEGVKAQIDQNKADGQLQLGQYQAIISLYEANKAISLQRTKVISDNYFALKSLVAEASKVAAQVNAQMAASAYGTIHASAGVQGSDSMSSSSSTNVAYSYSGNVSSDPAPLTTAPGPALVGS